MALPNPREHQLEIIQSDARFKLALCGRRWNKSTAGLICCVAGHGSRRQWVGALNGGKIGWITSTNKNANNVIWPMLKRSARQTWMSDQSMKREQEKSILLPNGGQVTVWSAESPDAIRGDGLDGVVIDEAAFASAYLWFDVLRPALIDSRGWAMFTTTPNGHNWFHKLWRSAQSMDDWDVWRYPTWHNPHISDAEMESLKEEARIFGHSIDQELGAKFVKPGGSEWDSNLFGDHNVISSWPKQVDLTVIAVDPAWGKKDGDYQAVVAAGLSTAGHGEIYLEARMLRVGKKEMANNVVNMALDLPSYPANTVVEEPKHDDDDYGHYAEAINLSARERGTAINVESILQTSHKVPGLSGLKGLKQLRIRQLDKLIVNQRLRFIDSPGTRLMIDQFCEFPSGSHDDGPDAAARAVDALRQVATELIG